MIIMENINSQLLYIIKNPTKRGFYAYILSMYFYDRLIVKKGNILVYS